MQCNFHLQVKVTWMCQLAMISLLDKHYKYLYVSACITSCRRETL